MPTTLIVWLLEPPRFVLADTASRAVIASGSDLAQLPPTKPDQTVALVPGELVYSTCVTLAAKQRAKQLKALGFLLEDELATDLEALHWVSFARTETERDVLVVERQQLDRWLNELSEAGIRADVLSPDYLAAPAVDVIAAAGNKWLLRTGGNSGAAAEPELIAALYRERLGREPPLEVANLSAADLVQSVSERKLPNLLAQHYGTDADRPSPLRPYRWAAIAATLAGTLWLLHLGLSVYRLDRAEQQLSAEMEAVFRQAVPRATRIIDPQAQLNQALKDRSSSGGANDALGLMSALGRAKHNSPGLKIKAMSFRDGGLQVDIQARALADLDRLMASLGADTQVRAEVKSAASGADGVSARLNVIAGAGS
jgi:general secretion pathway protein L